MLFLLSYFDLSFRHLLCRRRSCLLPSEGHLMPPMSPSMLSSTEIFTATIKSRILTSASFASSVLVVLIVAAAPDARLVAPLGRAVEICAGWWS